MDTRPYPQLSEVDGRLYIDSYKGVEFIYMDFSNMKGNEGLKIMDKWIKYIENPNLVVPDSIDLPDLVLTNGTNTPINAKIMKKLKKFGELSRKNLTSKHPVKKGASYGGARLAQVFLNVISRIMKLKIKGFATKEEALEWLIHPVK